MNRAAKVRVVLPHIVVVSSCEWLANSKTLTRKTRLKRSALFACLAILNSALFRAKLLIHPTARFTHTIISEIAQNVTKSASSSLGRLA